MDFSRVISVTKNAFDVIRLINRVNKNLMQLVTRVIEKTGQLQRAIVLDCVNLYWSVRTKGVDAASNSPACNSELKEKTLASSEMQIRHLKPTVKGLVKGRMIKNRRFALKYENCTLNPI